MSATTFPIRFKNDSKVMDADKIYIVGSGQDPNYNSSATYPVLIQSWLKVDGSGNVTFEHGEVGQKSSDYAVKLSDLPTDDSGNYELNVPMTTSGRIYISLGSPVDMHTMASASVVDGAIDMLTIVDPDGFLTQDPSYSTIFDKVEFTYNSGGVWINTTAVDFFGLPISLHMDGEETKGLTSSRADIMSTLKAGLTGEWSRLYLEYGGQTLRVVAPNKAIGRPSADENFPDDYLATYIDAVWTYYASDNEVSVNCAELYDKAPESKAVYTGNLGNGNLFYNGDGTVADLPNGMPTSNEVFGCAGGPMDAKENNPESVIAKNLGTAMNVGVFPLPESVKDAKLDKNWFVANSGLYYPDAADDKRPGLPEGGPWYNLYSKVLHSIKNADGSDEMIYAFAFDDNAGQDSTLHPGDGSVKECVVQINDLTGTEIPDPVDHTKYSVTVNLPENNTGTFDGQDLSAGANGPFADISSPFKLVFNGTEYEINALLKSATPQLIGLVVDTSNSPNISVNLPNQN